MDGQSLGYCLQVRCPADEVGAGDGGWAPGRISAGPREREVYPDLRSLPLGHPDGPTTSFIRLNPLGNRAAQMRG